MKNRLCLLILMLFNEYIEYYRISELFYVYCINMYYLILCIIWKLIKDIVYIIKYDMNKFIFNI